MMKVRKRKKKREEQKKEEKSERIKVGHEEFVGKINKKDDFKIGAKEIGAEKGVKQK